MVQRRDFLKILSASAAFCIIPQIIRSKGEAAASSQEKPNILFIMSDEHNASVLGCYGNKIIKTKNLDELSKNGVTFDTCYCNSPLCVPSRESFLSGKYVSRYGIWSNNCELPDDNVPVTGIMVSRRLVRSTRTTRTAKVKGFPSMNSNNTRKYPAGLMIFIRAISLRSCNMIQR